MVGMATLTMLESRTDMNMPVTRTASGGSHDPAGRSPPPTGDGEAGATAGGD
jgi:hypothetical protein